MSLFAAVRLEAVERPWLWLLFAAAGAAVLYFTYRGIFLRSERRLAWLLMALRGTGVALLLLTLARPTWTRATVEEEPGHVAVVLDDSLSMSLADAGGGGTRYRCAVEAVERLRAALGRRSDGALVVDLFDLQGNECKAGPPPEPTAERTDLVQAVSAPVAKLRSRPLAAVVLLSDGMDTTDRQSLVELGTLPVPVHAVGFAADPRAATLDLAVGPIRAPERAMIHNDLRIEVPVSKSGGPPTKATAVVKRGRDVVATRAVEFAEGKTAQLVAVGFKPTEPGQFVYTAAVEAETGERLLANNAVHFPLRVEKEPIRVLYVEGFLRYEYRYLTALLRADPDVRLDARVRRPNPELGAPRLPQELLTAEVLKTADVVLLGDMDGSYLTSPEYQALARWLDDKGRSLLVLGGYHSTGPDGFRVTPLADVLPVVFAEKPPFQSEEPFQVRLTDEGARHPIFALSGDRTADAAAWATAPALGGLCLVQRAKPGAEVLAVHPGLWADGKPALVAAVQRAGGGGHAMVLAADTTWHWSRLPRLAGREDTLYARFWSQTVRFLAGRGPDDARPLLTASTDQPSYAVGKAVTVNVLRQARPGADPGGDVSVEVRGPSGKSQSVPLRANSSNPHLLTCTYTPPTGGRYEVLADLKSDGKVAANAATEFRVHGSDLELADPGTNPRALAEVARLTGGAYVDVSEAESLAERLTPKSRRHERVERTEYWNSPWLFLAFLGAVTSEWLLRRRNHLV